MMKHISRTVGMKFATTLCLVVLFVAVRSTGALQFATASGGSELANDKTATSKGRILSDHDADDVGRSPDAPVKSDNDADDTVAPTTNPTNTTPPSTGGGSTGGGTAPTAPMPVVARFRNGTYSALGSYSTPDGKESINVTLVLSDGVVIDSAVTVNATSQPSKNYQKDFIAEYKQYVVGKKIDQLNLSKVAGASLTTIGFNNATDAIENQARA